MILHILFYIALFCYFIATLLYWLNFSIRKSILFKIGTGATLAGFVANTAYIAYLDITLVHPIFTNLENSLVGFAWLVAMVYIIAESKYATGSLGSFLMPLAFLSLSFSLFAPEASHPAPEKLKSIWMSIHIVFGFLGFAAFALIFGAGLMYIIQEKQLKSKRLGTFYHRLPSLETLDMLNSKAQSIGFPFLTLGLIAGSIWAQYGKGSYFNWDVAKTLPLILTWFIYAFLFVGRIVAGWRGRRTSWLAVAGFFLVIFTYFLHTI